MDINEICINCFQETGGEEICMHCGFQQVDRPKQICHLYPHTILYDRYIIGKVINNGGFGVVYKAYDMQLENIVAIKELLPTQNSMVTRMPPSQTVIPVNDEKNEQFQKLKMRFMEEARVIAQFSNCESIIHIYDFFEANNTAYLVMEFLDGQTLREKMNVSSEKMPYEEAIGIVMPIMNALKIVHEKGIVHKDVSPDNIFLCNDGRVKLIDFGASKFSDSQITIEENSVITKPGYTPPEQYRLNGKIGPYSDIYSVGAVLYTILSGDTPEESIDRLEKDNLQKLNKLGVELPVYAEKSIMKALALKETARFKSMDDFVKAICGKKRADYPEVELKKKKIRNVIIVILSFAVMFSAVVAAYIVKSHSSLIPSKSATITLWYCDNSEEGLNERWDDIAEDFNSFAANQNEKLANTKLDVVGIPADEYEDKLKKAFEDGNAPDIYQSTDVGFEEYSYSLKTLYKELDKNIDTASFEIIKDELKEHNTVAACFDLPVLYAYTDNTKNELPSDNAELDDLKNAKIINGFKYSLLCNPDAVLYSSYAYGYTDKSSNDKIVNTLYNASKVEEKGKYKNPQAVFTSGSNAMYYMGFMSEYSEISKNIRLGTSSFKVESLTGANTKDVYVLPEIWGISDESSYVNKKTAELFLYFLICTEDGQNDTVKVDNNTYYLPVLKEAVDSIGYDDYRTICNSSNSKTVVEYDKIFSTKSKSKLLSDSAKNVKENFDDAKKYLSE